MVRKIAKVRITRITVMCYLLAGSCPHPSPTNASGLPGRGLYSKGDNSEGILLTNLEIERSGSFPCKRRSLRLKPFVAENHYSKKLRKRSHGGNFQKALALTRTNDLLNYSSPGVVVFGGYVELRST